MALPKKKCRILESGVIVSFLLTLRLWCSGPPTLPMCHAKQLINVWWNSRSSRPSKPKLNSCIVHVHRFQSRSEHKAHRHGCIATSALCTGTMISSVLVVVVAHDVEVEHQQGDLQGVVVVVHDIELVLFEVREDLCLVHEAYQYFR